MPTDQTPSDGDKTLALPITDTAPDQTLPTPAPDEEETTAVPVEETRPLPVADPATSPIGALYTPAERPDRPGPADAVTDSPEAVVPTRRRLRVGTVVWGLVIAAIGVGLLAWAAGFEIDVQLAMIVLLAVAGTALLVGSIVSGARNARR